MVAHMSLIHDVLSDLDRRQTRKSAGPEMPVALLPRRSGNRPRLGALLLLGGRFSGGQRGFLVVLFTHFLRNRRADSSGQGHAGGGGVDGRRSPQPDNGANPEQRPAAGRSIACPIPHPV